MDKTDLSNYKKQLHTINMKKMIAISIILAVVSVTVFIALRHFFAPKTADKSWWIWLAAVVAMLLMFFVHELLHALSFIVIGGSKPSDIKFGGNAHQGILYCTSTKPLKKGAYVVTILFPFIVTLIAGVLLSVLQGHLAWSIVSGVLIGGCAGDIMMAWKIARLNSGALMLDHPTAPAYYELCDANNLPKDFVEVTAEQEQALQKDMDDYETASTKTNKILAWVLLGLFVMLAGGVIYILATL